MYGFVKVFMLGEVVSEMKVLQNGSWMFRLHVCDKILDRQSEKKMERNDWYWVRGKGQVPKISMKMHVHVEGTLRTVHTAGPPPREDIVIVAENVIVA